MVKRDTNAFRQRFERWKNGEQVYDKGRPITYSTGKDEDTPTPPALTVKAGDKVNTTQCAAWSNGWLRENGYLTHGNAWNLKNVDVLYNGYSNMKKPSKYDLKAIQQYNHAAADSVYKNFDSSTLDKSKPYAVNMFYNGSPAQEEAYRNGDHVTGTHTGALVFNPSKNRWYVTHNIHGTIHQEPFVQLQSGKGKYGVTAIYQPRENTFVNKVKGLFGFKDGKDGYGTWLDQYNTEGIVKDLMGSSDYDYQRYNDLYDKYTTTRSFRRTAKKIGFQDDNTPKSVLQMQPHFDDWLTNSRRGRRAWKRYDRAYEKQYTRDINDIFDAMNYIDKYYKYRGISPNKNNPNLRFDIHDGGIGSYNPADNEIAFGMNDFSRRSGREGFDAYSTAAHEYGHYYDKYIKDGAYGNLVYPLSYGRIYQKHRPDPLNPNAFQTHDSLYSENYADQVEARALMNKYGIYDSTSGEQITDKQIRKFRKKYGNESRLFRMFDDDAIKDMFQNIAYTPAQQNGQGVMYAQNGYDGYDGTVLKEVEVTPEKKLTPPPISDIIQDAFQYKLMDSIGIFDDINPYNFMMYKLASRNNLHPLLFEDGKDSNRYNHPETFLGSVTRAITGSAKAGRTADITSATAQLFPQGMLLSVLDFGRDANRAFHGENGAKQDMVLDAAAMLPFVSKLGLKTIRTKSFMDALKQAYNGSLQSVRTPINAMIASAIGADYVNDTLGADQTTYKNGKDSGIHIKPSHRGKFTALKKRTGHSASWFKAHGTPAQKKMATFELNARKWKH